jgi:propionyl-CoA synthetase
VTEACVVGIPDALKGQLPFAFVTTSSPSSSPLSDTQLLTELQTLIRTQVGPIASLGGMIRGRGMIPKTRSGKTLRRVLRELVENGARGEVGKAVEVPGTVEDAGVVEVARGLVGGYFARGGVRGKAKL